MKYEFDLILSEIKTSWGALDSQWTTRHPKQSSRKVTDDADDALDAVGLSRQANRNMRNYLKWRPQREPLKRFVQMQMPSGTLRQLAP